MIFKGNGIVWDAEKGKVLCKFEKGELETEDTRIIKILTEMKYENDGVEEVEGFEDIKDVEDVIEDVEIDLNDKTVVELRELAKEQDMVGIYNKTKDELIQALEGE